MTNNKGQSRKWLAVEMKPVGHDGWGFWDWIHKKYKELQQLVVQ